ncbi:cell division cycle protein 123 homolog [Acanthaster planci]|uniref:Cell division cycle protein 123 homolog n=1 Tax=Acanthaster planci TaxID=133434 RepID=A0A8B7ZL02_ACAPL|nr:cell division cycle protein 123 homolog [Acanthaster planci]XP_022103991.1 cell division cycle protein 123 homolog [Acanthaster planci]XP_022103992.1 cell division cycle protein 123 homolog [Acanthaster planci]
MKKQQVLDCSFSSWYPIFKHITIDSHVIPLSKDFLEYLDADGIYLPASPNDEPSNIIEEEEEDGNPSKIPSFPGLEESIRAAIQDLGGRVFPKLNWSAPRDASWIACGNTLQCTCVNDIFLLLKSSDFITHDLTEPFKHCTDCEQGPQDTQYELVLRRWCDISEATEFRVFVKNDDIIGISQRDHTNYFPDLGPSAEQIHEEIEDFHDRHIAGNFLDHDYVYDVYRQDKRKFLLIDFNPFGETTDSLLFSWAELNDLDVASTDSQSWETFRYVRSAAGIQPSQFLSYRYPVDVLHLTTGVDADRLVDFLRTEMQKPYQQEPTTSTQDDSNSVQFEDLPEK